MTIDDILSKITPEAIWMGVQNFWLIPAGMVALYFYGSFHFNTPAYALEMAIDSSSSTTDRARLITLVPPIFTTRRQRYNSYAIRYILILEVVFIAIVATSLVYDVSRIEHLGIPDLSAETVQYRALFALFALTGLLSSFPGFREIDGWILDKLHKAAFIPTDARVLAEKLYYCTFEPLSSAVEAVRPTLSMRTRKGHK